MSLPPRRPPPPKKKKKKEKEKEKEKDVKKFQYLFPYSIYLDPLSLNIKEK